MKNFFDKRGIKSCAVMGMQWGDEGKGKLVDVISEDADVCARWQGGDNAGHTVCADGDKVVMHILPTGALHGCDVILGRGVVLNIEKLYEDMQTCEKYFCQDFEVYIDDHTPIITPYHISLDEPEDGGKIGTTSRGIGPTYQSYIGRDAILFRDVILENESIIKEKLSKLKLKLDSLHPTSKYLSKSISECYQHLIRQKNKLKNKDVYISNTQTKLKNKLHNNKKVLFEGAQGAHLSIYSDDYPYVTSSDPNIGGLCSTFGISPSHIDWKIGVTKAYTTRVGNGEFLPEDFTLKKFQKKLRNEGNEYGATTGRPRRCGWLDHMALQDAMDMNDFDEICLTKLDVLDTFDVVKLIKQEFESGATKCKTINFPNWEPLIEDGEVDIKSCHMNFISSIDNFQNYENILNLLSYSPDREDIMYLYR